MNKSFRFIIMPAIIVAFLTSCGPSTEDAITYNDAISNEQIAVIDKIDNVFSSFKNFVPEEMDKAYNEARLQIDSAIFKVSKLEAFDGNNEFRDSTLVLLRTYKTVFDNEINEMVTIYKLPDNEYTKEQEDKCNLLSDDAIKKMDEGLQRLKKIQLEFAKKYKFEIKRAL